MRKFLFSENTRNFLGNIFILFYTSVWKVCQVALLSTTTEMENDAEFRKDFLQMVQEPNVLFQTQLKNYLNQCQI